MTSQQPPEGLSAAETNELIEALRSPSWTAEQHDPKAIYRTRPVSLFEAAADELERLSALPAADGLREKLIEDARVAMEAAYSSWTGGRTGLAGTGYMAQAAVDAILALLPTSKEEALASFSNRLSVWRDIYHDCDCPAHQTCGCKELREIIQDAEIAAAPTTPETPAQMASRQAAEARAKFGGASRTSEGA